MKDLIKKRIEKLTAESDKQIALMINFYTDIKFLAAEVCDREALELRHGIPQARGRVWELQRRTSILKGCLDQPSDEAVLDYLEFVDGAAMQALEKGLPEKSTHMDFLEFLGRGFECDECRNTITALKLARDLREKKPTRENARKRA